MKPDLLVAFTPRALQMAQLEEAYTCHRYDRATDKPAFLAEFGPRCRAMFCNGHLHVDTTFLDNMPALEMIAVTSAGFETIDVGALKARGIRMTNTSDALVDDVADMAVLLMLAARRQLVEGDAYVRSGDWGQMGMFPLTTSTRGKKAGIVGLGNIGRAIAKRCEVFGLEIAYSGRTKKDVPYTFFDNPTDLAHWADILIVATSGGADTEHLISADVLRALGENGSFVNIARGTVVDEEALIAALENATIASAGLDVFENEPTPDARLLELPNVVLYPHHASGTVETRDAMHQLAVDNLAAFYAGQPLLTPVL
ncbi:2-hydroxyacid dehydrogenase [Falsirhodobacter sp. 20TX0035]|uniref:2-hydroxyacid dehydrogenase n=1 Tax=Falsirhodobacter sp. 20TX0035 TaxID=3022019 RepID=UPI002331470A|nr:2-hydroxyacid dehydrogenase [Falsirhodobacter sp. 20TX0035]MDB6454300.1 2-hydroxyacid dehydrogenase [Falsirhodobacter sp. 20TX0035]